MTPTASAWILEASPETFQVDVIDRSHQLPVVVDFWAAWCQPCRLLAPVLEKLAVEYAGKFLLVKADTERVPEAAAQFGVQSIPTVYGLRGGELVDMFQGLQSEAHIRGWLDRLLPSPAETLTNEARQLAATDPAAAEAGFRKAIELAPQSAAAKIALAELLLEAGRSEEAQSLVEQLAARGYLEPDAERLQARLERQRQGLQAGSAAACRAAVEAQPGDLDLRLKLAEALAAEGQYEPALETALDLISRDRKRFAEPARKLMVDIFHLLPADSQLVSDYRRRLSTTLY